MSVKRRNRDPSTDVRRSDGSPTATLRVDGTAVQFEDNAAVITNRKGEVKALTSRGPSLEAENDTEDAATAKQIV